VRRRGGLAIAAAALLAPAARAAGVQGALRRLGVLLYDVELSWDFLKRELPPALAGLGWQEGRNLNWDWRFADGDPARLPLLAAGLLRDGADVLLTRGTPATRALQQATRTVPIVTGVGDPVGSGFAASLAAPGANITGLSYAQVETATKQLELLRELAPRTARVLLLLPANRAPFAAELAATVERVARGFGLRPERALAAGADELRRALRTARDAGPRGALAAYVFSFGPIIDPHELAQALLGAGVPAVFEQRFYVDAGGLMSYRLNWDDQTQRTAVQLAKVLRGENPATIPFELPTRSEFVVNARSAKALGLAIPAALRARADEVVG
jgi:putative ABC transport system substrate-binding protein